MDNQTAIDANLDLAPDIAPNGNAGRFEAGSPKFLIDQTAPVCGNSPERPPWQIDSKLTEDDLPYSDGMPMESDRHVLQMNMLVHPLRLYWKHRNDFYTAGDMFVYFSETQDRSHDFRGPDVLVAVDVPYRERKSWVSWVEGKPPDVVIELLSESTRLVDKGRKKQIYQDKLRVPEYYWYDPFGLDFDGFMLEDGVYRPMTPDAQGRLISPRLGLALTPWEGTYSRLTARWLRWAALDGTLIPTAEEMAEQERRVAERERRTANRERRTAERERKVAERERMAAAQYRLTSEEATLRADRLAQKLRSLGINPDE